MGVSDLQDAERDAQWMGVALAQAQQAANRGEVPVGAVLVRDSRIIGLGHNCPVSTADPTAHAEIVTLRDAARRATNYRLPGSVMYVTLEPCAMCAGALIHARVERVVAATPDPRTGAAGSAVQLFAPGLFNHDVCYEQGVMQAQSAAMLRAFFRGRRGR